MYKLGLEMSISIIESLKEKALRNYSIFTKMMLPQVFILLLTISSYHQIGARLLFRGDDTKSEKKILHKDGVSEKESKPFASYFQQESKATTSSNIGMCCSSCTSTIPAGTPTMDSVWWSNQLPNGAKIQIRANTWSTWWTPKDGVNWNSTIKAYNTTVPPASIYFTVIRVDTNRIKLRTLDGRFVRAGSSYPPVMTYGQIDTTKNTNDPATIFTVQRVGNFSIFLKCYDGLYLSSTGEYLMRWQGSKPDAWEKFDIREVQVIPAIRGVNLGSWLVFERWMTPNLYPNPLVWKDGTAIQFQSMLTGEWIALDESQDLITLSPNSTLETTNTTFNIRRTLPNAGKFEFVSDNLKFWSIANGTDSFIFSNQDAPGSQGYENFDLVFQSNSSTLALLLAPNGNYVCISPSGKLQANVPKNSVMVTSNSTWSGPCAFNLTVVYSTDGEWQLSNQLGSKIATQNLNNHHATFITEADWAYMKKQKINTVRIPIGYWLTQDTKPDAPFVPVYTKYLDWAFTMGNKYGIRIWISLHGLPGSQSGWSNTGTRDGTVRFPLNNNPKRSLETVRWIASRYAKNPMWLGIGLMNEGTTDIPLDIFQSYYLSAYEVIRTYSPCAFISLEERIDSNPWTDVFWLMLDNYHTNTMLETHAYEVFGGIPATTTEEEINFMKTIQVQNILGLQSYGQKLMVGEFSNAMKIPGTKSQNLEFYKAQIQTYSRANMGWFFWSLKLGRDDFDGWSWYKSSTNGWIPRKPDGSWW